MKWKKIIIFGSLLSVFVPAFLSSPSYAINDYVYVWDWDSHPSYTLCGGTSDILCSDYSYVIFEPSGICTDNGPSFWVSGVGSSTYNSLISVCSKIIAPLDSSRLFITGGRYLDTRYSGGNITITLTQSLSPNAPSGSLSITSNGTYDVTEYAEVDVDVPPEIQQGDYHNDLISINQSILTCGAICLVIYFFYCIYRMIIKPLGGR